MSNEALAKVLAHKNPLTRMYREGTWPKILAPGNDVLQYRNPFGDWFLFWSKPVIDRRAVGFELWYSYVVLPHR